MSASSLMPAISRDLQTGSYRLSLNCLLFKSVAINIAINALIKQCHIDKRPIRRY